MTTSEIKKYIETEKATVSWYGNESGELVHQMELDNEEMWWTPFIAFASETGYTADGKIAIVINAQTVVIEPSK